jgi:hypothetical protein
MNDNRDKHIDPAGSVTFRAQALWFGETGYPEDHPTQMVADIESEFAEATSDMLIYLGNCAAVNLIEADPEWREHMATMLENDLRHITKLVENATRIIRSLSSEPPFYSVEIAPELTGNPVIDGAEAAARFRLIEVLEAGADPEVDAIYRWLSDRVTELQHEEEGR